MDAVIAVKVSRTGVVLSCLFGQMAVCVLITDWVLDTVNTIKEETSFICSASPTHRRAHRKETHTHQTGMRTVCQRHKEAQANRHIYTHNRTQTRACTEAARSVCTLLSKNAQSKWIATLGANAGGRPDHTDLLWCQFSCRTHFPSFRKRRIID